MDLPLLALVAGSFLLGGFVKGTIGIGMSLVAIPVLSLALPPYRAIALVVAPVLISNLWQAWETRIDRTQLLRFLPLILALMFSTTATVKLTLGLPPHLLGRLIAASVLLAITLMVWRPELKVPPHQERRWSVAVGGLSGMMGGVSAQTGPLIITYLMALRVSRESFVGCMSVIYLSNAVPLYASMYWYGRLGAQELMLSALALIPMTAGLMLGKACRGRIGEAGFRRLLLAVLGMLAVALILKSLRPV